MFEEHGDQGLAVVEFGQLLLMRLVVMVILGGGFLVLELVTDLGFHLGAEKGGGHGWALIDPIIFVVLTRLQSLRRRYIHIPRRHLPLHLRNQSINEILLLHLLDICSQCLIGFPYILRRSIDPEFIILEQVDVLEVFRCLDIEE